MTLAPAPVLTTIAISDPDAPMKFPMRSRYSAMRKSCGNVPSTAASLCARTNSAIRSSDDRGNGPAEALLR